MLCLKTGRTSRQGCALRLFFVILVILAVHVVQTTDAIVEFLSAKVNGIPIRYMTDLLIERHQNEQLNKIPAASTDAEWEKAHTAK